MFESMKEIAKNYQINRLEEARFARLVSEAKASKNSRPARLKPRGLKPLPKTRKDASYPPL